MRGAPAFGCAGARPTAGAGSAPSGSSENLANAAAASSAASLAADVAASRLSSSSLERCSSACEATAISLTRARAWRRQSGVQRAAQAQALLVEERGALVALVVQVELVELTDDGGSRARARE